MAIDLKLSMKLGQQMVMTPQLQAAIKLLQMNRLELADTINAELMENPMLEESSDMSELDQKKAEIGQNEDSGDRMTELNPEKEKAVDFDWDSYLEQSFSYTGKSSRGLGFDPNQEDGPNYEAFISANRTLTDHLLDQVNTSDFSEEEKALASVIISSLDEWGYLLEPLDEVAKRAEVSVEDADFVLRLMQEFDPPGVCARDLKECLLLQIKQSRLRKSDRLLVQELVENHLALVEKRNYKLIAKEMGLEMDELAELIHLLQKFEPRPGRNYVESDNPYIVPDIYIHKMNGEYVISLNEDGLPKLKISHLYKNILRSMPEAAKLPTAKNSVEKELQVLSDGLQETAPVSKESPREYIQNKLRGAVWLIRSIHQRQRTIYKVTESIVKSQRDFLENGVTHLKPMVLKDIASDIGMHESTISRVTSNKYVHTPQGIFELKYFFSSAIQKTNGQDIASESVKEKIKTIVKLEDMRNPISDQGIVDELRKQGIEIARRTVAKYREMLGILPSSQRKSLF